MHDFKMVFKVMNKHCSTLTIKVGRLWNVSNIIMLQLLSLRKHKIENIGISYLEKLFRCLIIYC